MENSKEKAFSLIICTLLLAFQGSTACDHQFEGFGAFLGATDHFARSPEGVEAKVLDAMYNNLGIRLFRTSYEQTFSPSPDVYEIKCTEDTANICAWIRMHQLVGNLSDAKVFASIWSPPHYMKNANYQLMQEFETPYLYYIRNITQIMQTEFNITIEKVSPVNEPENVVAPWDHTNMAPQQLCRIVRNYNDSLVSICPENSYFWVSRTYFNFSSTNPELDCHQYCDVFASHAYALNVSVLLAYYDQTAYPLRGYTGAIWQTEVSSTYHDAYDTQMGEAIDFAVNIINFVGTTCIQRYYYWLSYTLGSSGESLIWGESNGDLFFPKKFFVYKLFVNASNTNNGAVAVQNCDDEAVANVRCVQFGDKDQVLANKEQEAKHLTEVQCDTLCCTTETEDWDCQSFSNSTAVLPAKSVCHCVLSEATPQP